VRLTLLFEGGYSGTLLEDGLDIEGAVSSAISFEKRRRTKIKIGAGERLSAGENVCQAGLLDL
jgi:hypothetical protein